MIPVKNLTEAQALDAADGVIDGKFYGQAIQGLGPNGQPLGQGPGSQAPGSKPAAPGWTPPSSSAPTSVPPSAPPSAPPKTFSAGAGAGGGGVVNDAPGLPQWSGSNVRPLEASMVSELRKFNITEAAQSSVTNAVKLLNDLGEAWQNDYAIIFSKQSHTWWMLAREGAVLDLNSAVEAHKKITPGSAKSNATKDKKSKEERKKFPLEKRLCQGIVGQRGAIASTSQQIRRKENGWHSTDHPLVFLFLGSSGIGKTELAKQIAKYVHEDDKDGFIRLDMSEYQSQHEVSKFIGAPPGYQGYDDGGQLTKKLKRCPGAVVLFDEVEKAHPDILTCLLATFDEGRLTDGKGETIECCDATFVMTSNLAQKEIADEAVRVRAKLSKAGQTETETAREIISPEYAQKVIMPILKGHFKRDEFLGRINEILFFLPFTEEQKMHLANREIDKWSKIAKKRHNMEIQWSTDVEEFVVKAYDPRFGVRSIQHEVGRQVVSRLAAAHEEDKIGEGDTIILGIRENEVVLRMGAKKS